MLHLAEAELKLAQMNLNEKDSLLLKQREALDKANADVYRLMAKCGERVYKSGPDHANFKDYGDLGPKGRWERIKKLVEAIFSHGEKLNKADIDDIHDRLARLFQIPLITPPPTRKFPYSNVQKQDKLDALADLKMFSALRWSWKQREALKIQLRAAQKDILAPTHAVRDLAQEMSQLAVYEWTNGARVIVNLEEYLTVRLQRLANNNKLHFLHQKNEVWCGVGGDKGGGTVKFILNIANVFPSNSVNNLSILGIYEGSEDAVGLRTAFSHVCGQLSKIKTVSISNKQYRLRLFPIGDMKFLCSFFGHLGANSAFPCLICTAGQEEIRRSSRVPVKIRNIAEMAKQGQLFQNARPTSQAQRTTLSKAYGSMEHPPLLNIPVTDIVPSPLHIAMGLAQVLVEAIEALMPGGATNPSLQTAYRAAGVIRLKPHHMFSGRNKFLASINKL
jgi:hypothetical protein